MPLEGRSSCAGTSPTGYSELHPEGQAPCPAGTRIVGNACVLDARPGCPPGLAAGADGVCGSSTGADVAGVPGKPAEADRQTVRALLRAGIEHERAGELTEAADEFERAWRMGGSRIALFDLAIAEVSLGKLVRAAQHLRLAAAPVPDAHADALAHAGDDRDREIAARAVQRLEELERRTPTLQVRMARDPEPAAASVDGYAVAPALLLKGLALDPGVHDVVLAAPGRQPHTERALLTVGERYTIAAELLPRPAPPTMRRQETTVAPSKKKAQPTGRNGEDSV